MTEAGADEDCCLLGSSGKEGSSGTHSSLLEIVLTRDLLRKELRVELANLRSSNFKRNCLLLPTLIEWEFFEVT